MPERHPLAAKIEILKCSSRLVHPHLTYDCLLFAPEYYPLAAGCVDSAGHLELSLTVGK